MLHAVGIIAEYNPFHNGHEYQLKMAKKKTNADVCIVVMSGDWVQRGDPAILDKWLRANFALQHGADLVVELPAQFAVQPVNIFAAGGVKILNQLNCDALSFGCKTPGLNFNQLANVNLDDMNDYFHNYFQPYPKLFQGAFYKQTGQKIHDPNDILGINYAHFNSKFNSPMKIIPIKRQGTLHNEGNIKQRFASSSTIREMLVNHIDSKSKLLKIVDSNIIEGILKQRLVTWNDFWPMLKFELVTSSLSDLKNIYQMNEGIEYRLKRFAITSKSFNEFIDKVKTKRYTYSRLKRLFGYILFHLKRDDYIQNEYLRILGFNQIGRKYLNQEKKKIQIPIISRASQKMLNSVLQLDFKAGMLYEMITGQSQDLYRHPIIK